MASAADVALFPLRQGFKALVIAIQAFFLLWFLYAAYDIRLYPVKEFGYIIHEFDPWFNYRATEYLAENGLDKFFHWYDYESWYPIGRPVGTTIYPGMQMTAVAIWEGMKQVGSFSVTVPAAIASFRPLAETLSRVGFQFFPKIPAVIEFVPMSINDICCMIPAWFGSLATIFTALMAYEISRSNNAAIATAGIMAIMPAHLMRSMAGEFDNEAVAVTAIVATFWLWMRSVRTPGSWPWGILAGLSYAYAAAAWGGGPIFVLNMVGMHALILVLMGRFNYGVHRAYSLFWVIGTAIAVQVPVIGMQPLRSLEQMGPFLAFLGIQVLAFCDMRRRSQKLSGTKFTMMRIQVVAVFLAVLVGIACILWPMGYFGPLSSRIRGLFVKHTKTGNPLVDSVAEHQPASPSMYGSYLGMPLDYVLMGGLVCLWRRNNSFYFMALYGFIAQHFSGKMSRLVLICAPITSIACGIWCGFLLDHMIEPFLLLLGKRNEVASKLEEEMLEKAAATTTVNGTSGANSGKTNGKPKTKGKEAQKPAKAQKKAPKAAREITFELEEWDDDVRPGGAMELKRQVKSAFLSALPEEMFDHYRYLKYEMHSPLGIKVRVVLAIAAFFYTLNLGSTIPRVRQYMMKCDQIAQSLSNPQVVYKVRDRSGRIMHVDDYLKGYKWIDENTPKDARVMAWWDYGYQITGIARRTSIADGNTWNHEHIATLGRTLTSSERKAHNTIRHMADYVLVWAGGNGDDLAKSPHLARIGNSVFPDHCGDDDPKCNKFGFYAEGQPTPMMARSLLYKLCQNGLSPGVEVNPELFQEVHTTKYGLMRIYKVMNVSQESKDWIADPKNRVCDAPGSWYCVGQYPPAMEKLIAKRKNFAQLEDFNKDGGGKSAYTKLIEKELSGSGKKEL